MTTDASCWAMNVRLVLDHAVRRGLGRGALLDAVGLDEAALRRPEALVPIVAYYDLVEQAADGLGDPDFGVSAGLAMGDASLGALGFLGMTSPTLGEGLDAMLAAWSGAGAGERYELARVEDRAHLRYLPFGPPRPAHDLLAGFFLADVTVNVPPLVEGGVDGLAASIRAGADRANRLSSALGVPVAPRAPADALSFDAESLDRKMHRADPAMRGFFESYLAERAAPPATTVPDRVRRLVDDRLPDGALDRESIAAALRVSVRTLQRQLRAGGTSLSKLVRERRLLRARALLDEGRSMSEAAYEVGYSEASALHRALRRIDR